MKTNTEDAELRDLLRSRNFSVQRELESLSRALTTATISPRLQPFADRLGGLCETARKGVEKNLRDLSLDEDVLGELLSSTCGALDLTRLLSQRMAAPVFRASADDEAALKIISWMHSQHPRTQSYAAACAVGDVGVLPFIQLAPVYFFPCLESRGLLYLVLLCHEFGHLLHKLYELEINALVRELQQDIEELWLPVSGRNDRRSENRALRQRIVVDNWNLWARELFCDAVGLWIGGPAYLFSFSAYCGTFQRENFSLSIEKLDKSEHPVHWLRAQILVERARYWSWETEAREVEREWNLVAARLGISEDYHGYFDDSLKPRVFAVLSDMLTVVGMEPEEPGFGQGGILQSRPWVPQDSPMVLLNQAWREVSQCSADEYAAWEEKALCKFICAIE